MIQTIETKKCPVCSRELRGRTDKVFCSAKCKNNLNNAKNRVLQEKIKPITEKLKQNYEILENLLTAGRKEVSSTELQGKGFDFNYLTNFKRNQSAGAKNVNYIYDLGYTQKDEKTLILLRA